jgi:hypothetical protein
MEGEDLQPFLDSFFDDPDSEQSHREPTNECRRLGIPLEIRLFTSYIPDEDGVIVEDEARGPDQKATIDNVRKVLRDTYEELVLLSENDPEDHGLEKRLFEYKEMKEMFERSNMITPLPDAIRQNEANDLMEVLESEENIMSVWQKKTSSVIDVTRHDPFGT